MSTFLVTGGCGFIGSHLCDALLARGDTVRVLDDLSSGHRHNLSDGVELIEGDVASPRCIGMALAGVDGCFHLAAIASVQRATRDRAGTHRTNVTGTITMLDQVKRLARPSAIPVVYASSAAVYGDGAVMPLAETCSPRPVSAYGAAKLACERQARAATFAHAIPTIGMRFFNVFGPRQNPASPYSGVISIFCDRIARGLPVDIFGDGMQTRDFVFVGDVVAALLRAMAMRPAGGPVFNVCTGRATTVLDLAGMIAGLSGTSARMRFGEARPGDIMAAGDNNPRVFAETITIDAWRSVFDGTSGEADLHVDVVFAEKGRVGGGDAPVRFRLSLKRAEVHVVRDSEDIIGIISSSVRRADQPHPGKAHHTTKTESRLAGGADGSLSTTSAKLSGKASVGTSVTVTDTLEHFEAVTTMEVTHWRTDRGYGFKIAARPDGARLKGQPWDASTPLMKIRDTNTKRKRGEPPELRVEIHCLREDLLIEEIEFTSDRFPLWSALSKKKQIAVEQFIKDELARVGLPCGDLSEPFTRIVIGDALPAAEP